MRISYFPNQVALNGREVMDAFLHSCKQYNIEPVKDSFDADLAVIWSMLWAGRMAPNKQIWEHYRSIGRDVIVLEVGSIIRNKTWRVGCNGVNGQGYFGPIGQNNTRQQKLGVELQPWRNNGEHILICLQRADSYQWVGQPEYNTWVDQTISLLKTYTERKILIRPHPRFPLNKTYPGVEIQQPKKIKNTYDSFDFEENLKDVWAVVNWNSNPGVQSIIHGIPAFVGPTSLAAPVGNLDWTTIEKPLFPDRQQWLNDLAYTEWDLEEISQGIPLRRIIADQTK